MAPRRRIPGVHPSLVPGAMLRPGGGWPGGIPGGRLFRTWGGVTTAAAPPGRLGSIRLHQDDAVPLPSGAQGSDVYPYDETDTWGANLPPGAGVQTVPPTIGLPTPPTAPAYDAYQPTTAPFGKTDPASALKWSNPSTFASVPINASTSITAPVLSLNYQRNALIVQNNSTATSPDVAATFYVGFNAQPSVGISLTLPPGVGIAFDIICPRDSIYVLFAGNSGATSVVQGVVVQGTYAPL